jgi:acyl transferase domain-containing protein
VRRSHFPHRAFCVTDALEAFEFSPLAKWRGLIFVFTRQDAQWSQMAKELIEDYPNFNADIEHLGDVLLKLAERPSWSIKEEVLKDATETQLLKAEFSQPLCTAVNSIRSWSVEPAAVVGHSSGEIAGAYAAGATTA